jgi:hypothetical protein
VRPRLAVLALASCAWGVLSSGTARASEAAARAVFDTAIAASDAEGSALVAAIEEVASGLGLRVRIEHRDAPPDDASWPDDVIAGVWIDARSPDRIEVRTTSGRAGSSSRSPSRPPSPSSSRRPSRSPPRSFARTLTRDGSEEVIVDEVAEVVRAALESVEAAGPETTGESAPDDVHPDGPDLVPSEPAESPPASPPAPHERPHGFGLDLIAFGSERAMSARASPVLGAGAALEASFGRSPWRPSVWLSAAYGSRFDAQGGPVTFDAGASSLRLLPGIGLVDLEAMQLDLDVGGGVDLFSVSPLIVRGTQATVGPTTHSVDPIAAAQLLMRLRLVSQLRLTFGFDVDYDLAPHDPPPPTGRGMEPHSDFVPWTFRPAIAIGLCVPLSSGGACTNSR